jgi:hypothetical protein
MPVAAVAAIAIGGYAAAGMIAAGTLMSFAGMAAMGSIIGGVGMLTGNKTLTKVGAVMGVVGGIGAWGSTAANFADGQALWEDPFKAAAAASGETAAAAGSIEANMASGSTAPNAAEGVAPVTENISQTQTVVDANDVGGGGLVDAGGDTMLDVGGGSVADAAGGITATEGQALATPLADSAQAMAPGAINPAAPGTITDSPITLDSAADKFAGAPDPQGLVNTVPGADPTGNITMPDGSTGKFNTNAALDNLPKKPGMPGEGIFKFMKENQILTAALLQGVQAGFSTDGDSRDAYYDAKTAETNAQMANANYVPGVGKYFPKTGPGGRISTTPAVRRRAGSGLMTA